MLNDRINKWTLQVNKWTCWMNNKLINKKSPGPFSVLHIHACRFRLSFILCLNESSCQTFSKYTFAWMSVTNLPYDYVFPVFLEWKRSVGRTRRNEITSNTVGLFIFFPSLMMPCFAFIAALLGCILSSHKQQSNANSIPSTPDLFLFNLSRHNEKTGHNNCQ